MDFDFDDEPSDHAAARLGARFKPKGRLQPKKKQVSISTSQTTLSTDVAKEKLSTQSEDPASLDGSSGFPNNASTSEIIVPESKTLNQSTSETFPEANVDILSRGVNLSTNPSLLRACSNVDLEGKRCGDGIKATFHDDLEAQQSAMVGDFVTPATVEDIHAQVEMMQTGEENCHLDMETLDIVQDEGITGAYEQHTGKLQPKARLLDTLVEEPESQYFDDSGYFSIGSNVSELVVNAESRKYINTNTTFYGELQELDIPEVPTETVPEMETQNAYGRWELGEQVVSPSTNTTVLEEEENFLGTTIEEEQSGRESKIEKSKEPTARKRNKPSEEEPNKSIKILKKKFKHSSRRQKITFEKELLETPDDEIRFLPIRDMLRLVEYREWVDKKEAKGGVVPLTQESSNMNTSDNQTQGFGAEDEFGVEESENQETNVVKPDSPVNYQTYMNKTSRTRWSKQDTELFYEGIREFGSNISMVHQLFPNRTRRQIKVKFKLEERRYPLKLNDALSSRSKHMTHFQNVIKKLQQEVAVTREHEEEEGGAEAETTTDVPENEEPTKSEETEGGGGGVKEWEGGEGECEDEGEDDFWNSYKSDM